MKTPNKEERAETVNMVRNGSSYTEAARKIGVSYEAVRRWCIKEGVHSSFIHKKRTDADVISTIKEAKVITQSELSRALNYQSMGTRLRGMIMSDKIKSTIIPAPSSAAKVRWPLAGYQNKRLYYIEDEDLSDWLMENLPKHMPTGMRRAVTAKLRSIGVNITELKYHRKYNSIALSENVYKKLKVMSEKKGLSLRVLVETLIEKGLESIE